MVVLIAEIEGNCFYIVLSILLVWHRSDLFNVSLQITGHVSLHNQTPLHITWSKLVFTSHCICFCYIMICPVSSAYTIGVASFAWPRYINYLLWKVISPVICFLVICFLPCLLTIHWFLCQQPVYHLFLLLCIYDVLADFEQVVVPVLLYLTLFVN